MDKSLNFKIIAVTIACTLFFTVLGKYLYFPNTAGEVWRGAGTSPRGNSEIMRRIGALCSAIGAKPLWTRKFRNEVIPNVARNFLVSAGYVAEVGVGAHLRVPMSGCEERMDEFSDYWERYELTQKLDISINRERLERIIQDKKPEEMKWLLGKIERPLDFDERKEVLKILLEIILGYEVDIGNIGLFKELQECYSGVEEHLRPLVDAIFHSLCELNYYFEESYRQDETRGRVFSPEITRNGWPGRTDEATDIIGDLLDIAKRGEKEYKGVKLGVLRKALLKDGEIKVAIWGVSDGREVMDFWEKIGSQFNVSIDAYDILMHLYYIEDKDTGGVCYYDAFGYLKQVKGKLREEYDEKFHAGFKDLIRSGKDEIEFDGYRIGYIKMLQPSVLAFSQKHNNIEFKEGDIFRSEGENYDIIIAFDLLIPHEYFRPEYVRYAMSGLGMLLTEENGESGILVAGDFADNSDPLNRYIHTVFNFYQRDKNCLMRCTEISKLGKWWASEVLPRKVNLKFSTWILLPSPQLYSKKAAGIDLREARGRARQYTIQEIEDILSATAFSEEDEVQDRTFEFRVLRRGLGFVVKIPKGDEIAQEVTRKGYRIASEYLGDLVARFTSGVNVSINIMGQTHSFDNVTIQEELTPLDERLEELIKERDEASIKRLLGKVIQLDREALSRGVYLSDNFLKQYGVDKNDNLFLLDLGKVVVDLKSKFPNRIRDMFYRSGEPIGYRHLLNKRGWVLYHTIWWLEHHAKGRFGRRLSRYYKEETGFDFNTSFKRKPKTKDFYRFEEELISFCKNILRTEGVRSLRDILHLYYYTNAKVYIEEFIVRNKYDGIFQRIAEQELDLYFPKSPSERKPVVAMMPLIVEDTEEELVRLLERTVEGRKLLEEDHDFVVRQLKLAYGRTGKPEEAVGMVLQGLHHSGMLVYADQVSKEAVQGLINRLNPRLERDWDRRIEAVRELGELKRKESVVPLIRTLIKDPVLDVRRGVAVALGEIGDKVAIKALEYIPKEDRGIADSIVNARARIKSMPSRIKKLINELDNPNEELEIDPKIALVGIGEVAVEPLMDFVVKGEGSLRAKRKAVWILGELRDFRASDYLEIIKDNPKSEEKLRREASLALDKIRTYYRGSYNRPLMKSLNDAERNCL